MTLKTQKFWKNLTFLQKTSGKVFWLSFKNFQLEFLDFGQKMTNFARFWKIIIKKKKEMKKKKNLPKQKIRLVVSVKQMFFFFFFFWAKGLVMEMCCIWKLQMCYSDLLLVYDTF